MLKDSQNHRMARVERDFKDHLVPTPPALSRDVFHQTRLLRAPSNLALNTAREGAATASLGNLFQCFTTLMLKNFFQTSNLNLPSFSLQPFPLVLSLHTLVISPSPSFLEAPFWYWKAAVRSPWSLLFSRLNSPNSLSLSSQERCSSPLINFVALLWTCSNRSMSFFCWGPQNQTQYSRWGLSPLS